MNGKEITLKHFELNPLCAVGMRGLPNTLQQFIVSDRPDAMTCVRDESLLASGHPLVNESEVSQALFSITKNMIKNTLYELRNQYFEYGVIDDDICRQLIDNHIHIQCNFSNSEAYIMVDDKQVRNWGELFKSWHEVVTGVTVDFDKIQLPYFAKSEPVEQIPEPDLFKQLYPLNNVHSLISDLENKGYRFDISNQDILKCLHHEEIFYIPENRALNAIVKAVTPQIDQQFKQGLLGKEMYFADKNEFRKINEHDLEFLDLGIKAGMTDVLIDDNVIGNYQDLEKYVLKHLREYNQIFENESYAKLQQEAKEFNSKHPILSIGFEQLPPIMWQMYQFFGKNITDDDVLEHMSNMGELAEHEIAGALFSILNGKMENFLLEYKENYDFTNDSYPEFIQDTFSIPLYFNYLDSHIHIKGQSIENLTELFDEFHQAALDTGKSQNPSLSNPFPETKRVSGLSYPYPQAFINLAEQVLAQAGMSDYIDIVDIENNEILHDMKLNRAANMDGINIIAMGLIADEVGGWLNGQLRDHPKLLELEQDNDEDLVYDAIEEYTDIDNISSYGDGVDTPVGVVSSFTPEGLLAEMADYIHEKVSEKMNMQNNQIHYPNPKF